METERHESIAQLAYVALEQLDPNSNELGLFRATQDEYFRNPQGTLDGIKVSDHPVGSGLGIGEIILTPVLLWIGGKLLDLAWDLVKAPVEEELSGPVSGFVRKLLQGLGLIKKTQPAHFPALSLTQQNQLRQKTLADSEFQKLTKQYALSPELTTQLVDVMVSQIPTTRK